MYSTNVGLIRIVLAKHRHIRTSLNSDPKFSSTSCGALGTLVYLSASVYASLYMCMHVYLYKRMLHVNSLFQRLKKGIESRAGVTGSCWMPDLGSGN